MRSGANRFAYIHEAPSRASGDAAPEGARWPRTIVIGTTGSDRSLSERLCALKRIVDAEARPAHSRPSIRAL